jgi:hypothetical protein
LLPVIGQPELPTFLILDIGTRIRYYLCLSGDNQISEMPFPSALGGGLVQGILQLLGFDDWTSLDDLAAWGAPPDLLAKDLDPEMGGTVGGETPLSHFLLADVATPLGDVGAGLWNVFADRVTKDLMVHQMLLRDLPGADQARLPPLVLAGTLLGRMPSLVATLKQQLGLRLFLTLELPYCEYLSALGALEVVASR